MNNELDVRAATTADLDRLLAIHHQLNPSDPDLALPDAARILDLLSKYPGSAILNGVIGDAVVATCTLIVIPNLTRGGAPYGLVENVVTDRNHRRRGFGHAVINHAVARAWEAGCYKAMLLTGSKDPGTLGFYRSIGFEQDKSGFQIRRIPARGA